MTEAEGRLYDFLAAEAGMPVSVGPRYRESQPRKQAGFSSLPQPIQERVQEIARELAELILASGITASPELLNTFGRLVRDHADAVEQAAHKSSELSPE